MKKAILFDLDGTLTDSGEGIINCAVMVLEHYGRPIPSQEELRAFVGPPLHESFVRHGIPADQTDAAIALYRSRYIPIGAYENTPYPGIRQLLEALKAAGHKLYVATSKPEETSVKILEHFDLDKYFDMICGATMDTSRSSKEAVIGYLLEQNGRADNMVMVGDTKFDIIGAKEHGIPAIGVSWGFGKIEDMEAAGACAIAHSMEELLNLLLA
ncbi:MAG: HAD-IA family hydrolase [Oscillospiraceae bacterium]|nr:HAD-IA family hydrolase [Oscillospiraceae bacterium]